MKMLQDVTDWFKAEILGDQSLQQERKKQKSQKDFEKRINENDHKDMETIKRNLRKRKLNHHIFD